MSGPRGSRAGGGGRWLSELARPGPSGATRLPRLGAGKNVPSHGAALRGAEVSLGLGPRPPQPLPPAPAPRPPWAQGLQYAASPRLRLPLCRAGSLSFLQTTPLLLGGKAQPQGRGRRRYEVPSALRSPDVRPHRSCALLRAVGKVPAWRPPSRPPAARGEVRRGSGLRSESAASQASQCLPAAHAACVVSASVTAAGWLSRRPSVGPFLLYSVQTLPRRGQGTSWSC